MLGFFAYTHCKLNVKYGITVISSRIVYLFFCSLLINIYTHYEKTENQKFKNQQVECI